MSKDRLIKPEGEVIELEGAPGELTCVPYFAVGKPEAQGGDGVRPEPYHPWCRDRPITPGHSSGIGRLYHTTGMVEASPGDGDPLCSVINLMLG